MEKRHTTGPVQQMHFQGPSGTSWGFTFSDKNGRVRGSLGYASKEDAENGKAAMDRVLEKVIAETWP